MMYYNIAYNILILSIIIDADKKGGPEDSSRFFKGHHLVSYGFYFSPFL